jgi:acid phosphatase
MHDCSVATGDAWLAKHLQPILDSDAYKSGSVLVEVWFDEDHPVPNLLLNPAIPAGVDTSTAASHLGALRLWEDLLGLPHLGSAATAVDLRPSLNLD